MRLTFQLLALLSAVTFLGCAHPRLTRSEAAGIAQRAAGVENHLAEYKKPVARYWLIPERGCWEVFFQRRAPMPGGDFSVLVYDRTGDAKVRGGM